MTRIILQVAALLLAGCGSSESDVLTDADIRQATAADKDIDRLDPELEPDGPPPSPEVSVAPLAMPAAMDRPDFDLPVTEEAKLKARPKAKVKRNLDSEALNRAIPLPRAADPVEPLVTVQVPSQPSSPVPSENSREVSPKPPAG
jgi:hypothetical protein